MDEIDPSRETSPPSLEPEIRIKQSHFFALLIPIVFAGGIAFGFWLRGQQASPIDVVAPDPAAASSMERVEVDLDDDFRQGPDDAPITIVEFSDFACPHCRTWHNEVFSELMATFPDQIQFVYRDFPIVGGGTTGFFSAMAANCAGEQGAYWEYHNALFSGDFPLDPSGFEAAAGSLGLDVEQLNECLVSGRHSSEIEADFQAGVALGINSTPTFFVNGLRVIGAQPLANFVNLINLELDSQR